MKLRIALCVFCLLATSLGCQTSDSNNLASVSGIVKAKGKPLSSGKIMFYPDGGGRPAIGSIGPDGSYLLTTYKKNDGAQIGLHHVTILAMDVDSKGEPKRQGPVETDPTPVAGGGEDIFDYPSKRPIWLIHQKYSDLNGTTITAEVVGGKNEIDFDSADFD